MKKLLILPVLVMLLSTVYSQKHQENDTNNVEFATNTDTVYIREYSIQSLEEMGITVKPAIYSLHYVHNVEFNNEEIPLNIYASFYARGDYFGQIDSLVFMYDGKKHNVWFTNRDLEMFNPTNIMRGDLIVINDYNFDGYMDIGIFNALASGTKNKTYETYLYYPKEKKYFYAKELSGMANLYVDKEREILSMFWAGGMASMVFGYSEYKWVEDDSLLLGSKLESIYSVNQESLYPLELFVRKTNTLINGVWKTQIDTLTSEQARDRGWPRY